MCYSIKNINLWLKGVAMAVENTQSGYAILELTHIVRACLEHGATAHQTIESVLQAADMGVSAAGDPVIQWTPLDPRTHYFETVEMGLANALLHVPPTLRLYYAEEHVPFSEMVVAICRYSYADSPFCSYAVVVGLNEVFSHTTVAAAVNAAQREREEGEHDLGF